jgi:spore coat polysaccharide biosynthesis predicted glycosyltransferase SpsG
MPVSSELRVLFRAPVGPRRGFGHLVRCRSLARALGVRPLISLRGGPRARAAARALGFEVVPGSAAAAIARVAPQVVVVDDLIPSHGRRWIAVARRAGCRVVTVHDLGLGARDGDLIVDGSVVRAATSRTGRALRGPQFAILDPAYASVLRAPRTSVVPRVLIALGGGPRAAMAYAIASAVRHQMPWARIRIAGGFAQASPADRGHIEWTGPLDGLASELSACDVAVVGGGVSLYEACARGVAAVAVPVVAAQRPTVRGFVALQAARGRWGDVDTDGVAREVVYLLRRPDVRSLMASRARRLVDGRGALRVAEAIRELVNKQGQAARRRTAAVRRAS